MKYILSFSLSFLMFSCSKEKVYPDLCPGCTYSSNLNGEPWEAKPKHSKIWIRDGDSTIIFSIIETEPFFHDDIRDILVIYFIPYKPGVHVFDSSMISQDETITAEFWVYENELGTPDQVYHVVPDSQSWVNVEELDKADKSYIISFFLKMSVRGGPEGPLYNGSYPKVIEFREGRIEGHLDFD